MQDELSSETSGGDTISSGEDKRNAADYTIESSDSDEEKDTNLIQFLAASKNASTDKEKDSNDSARGAPSQLSLSSSSTASSISSSDSTSYSEANFLSAKEKARRMEEEMLARVNPEDSRKWLEEMDRNNGIGIDVKANRVYIESRKCGGITKAPKDFPMGLVEGYCMFDCIDAHSIGVHYTGGYDTTPPDESPVIVTYYGTKSICGIVNCSAVPVRPPVALRALFEKDGTLNTMQFPRAFTREQVENARKAVVSVCDIVPPKKQPSAKTDRQHLIFSDMPSENQFLLYPDNPNEKTCIWKSICPHTKTDSVVQYTAMHWEATDISGGKKSSPVLRLPPVVAATCVSYNERQCFAQQSTRPQQRGVVRTAHVTGCSSKVASTITDSGNVYRLDAEHISVPSVLQRWPTEKIDKEATALRMHEGCFVEINQDFCVTDDNLRLHVVPQEEWEKPLGYSDDLFNKEAATVPMYNIWEVRGLAARVPLGGVYPLGQTLASSTTIYAAHKQWTHQRQPVKSGTVIPPIVFHAYLDKLRTMANESVAEFKTRVLCELVSNLRGLDYSAIQRVFSIWQSHGMLDTSLRYIECYKIMQCMVTKLHLASPNAHVHEVGDSTGCVSEEILSVLMRNAEKHVFPPECADAGGTSLEEVSVVPDDLGNNSIQGATTKATEACIGVYAFWGNGISIDTLFSLVKTAPCFGISNIPDGPSPQARSHRGNTKDTARVTSTDDHSLEQCIQQLTTSMWNLQNEMQTRMLAVENQLKELCNKRKRVTLYEE